MGIIIVGAVIGILAPLLQKLGNPGNMKITIAKNDLKIVNISGGGCPDVPYLAREMVGKSIYDAEAADLAARANRWAGRLAQPDPATQVSELIDHIPAALFGLLNPKSRGRSHER